jgi:hypothetical protein
MFSLAESVRQADEKSAIAKISGALEAKGYIRAKYP